jgi:glycosyltransferase involved in cell wall biosynthesis
MRVLHFLQPHGNQGGDPLAHVGELAMAQANSGHEVGIFCLDEGTGFVTTQFLARMNKSCSLGFKHIALDQHLAFSTITTSRQAVRFARDACKKFSLSPFILHGHGERGGELARHVQKQMWWKKTPSLCVYSAHGAPWHSDKTLLSFSSPRKQLWKYINGIIFESTHCQNNYIKCFGPPPAQKTRIIYEGLGEEEFAPRHIIDMASDFLFVGELTKNNGVDTLIKALARMKKNHITSALIVGSGPQEKELRAQVDRYGLSQKILFSPPLTAKAAFLKGSCLVLPSRDRNIPHVVMQAAAAGMPMILTNTGGLSEIIGDIKMPLIAADNTTALHEQMVAYLTSPQPFLERAQALQQRMANSFTLTRMNQETEQFYHNLMSEQ